MYKDTPHKHMSTHIYVYIYMYCVYVCVCSNLSHTPMSHIYTLSAASDTVKLKKNVCHDIYIWL